VLHYCWSVHETLDLDGLLGEVDLGPTVSGHAWSHPATTASSLGADLCRVIGRWSNLWCMVYNTHPLPGWYHALPMIVNSLNFTQDMTMIKSLFIADPDS